MTIRFQLFYKNTLYMRRTAINNIYNNLVINYFENPKNVGSFPKNTPNIGTGIVGAPACGDVMKLQIQVQDNLIVSARFKTYGCGSAIASSSYATDFVIGKSLDEAVRINNRDIAHYLKLPPIKLHCSMLAEDAIKKAIHDYNEKKN